MRSNRYYQKQPHKEGIMQYAGRRTVAMQWKPEVAQQAAAKAQIKQARAAMELAGIEAEALMRRIAKKIPRSRRLQRNRLEKVRDIEQRVCNMEFLLRDAIEAKEQSQAIEARDAIKEIIAKSEILLKKLQTWNGELNGKRTIFISRMKTLLVRARAQM